MFSVRCAYENNQKTCDEIPAKNGYGYKIGVCREQHPYNYP